VNQNSVVAEKKRRILYTIGRPETGGVQKLVFYLTKSAELAEYQHNVVCLRSCSGGMAERFLSAGVSLKGCIPRRMSLVPSYRLRYWLSRIHFNLLFTSALKSLKPDLVHIHNNSYLALQLRAINTVGIPWVWTAHGLGLTGAQRTVQDAIKNARGGYHLTAVSQAVFENLSGLSLASRGRVSVVYNGIDLRDYASYQPNDDSRAKWKIPENAVVFGTANSFIDLKRHDLLVDAAAELIRRGETACFVLAGEGPLESWLREHVKQRGLEKYFRFIGWQSDIRPFLGAIDVFVLTSDTEGFSVALLEASASGKPCVATRVGGVPELLGESGLLVSPGVLQELVDALDAMLYPEVRKEYSKLARENSLRFSISSIARQYSEIYQGLIAR